MTKEEVIAQGYDIIEVGKVKDNEPITNSYDYAKKEGVLPGSIVKIFKRHPQVRVEPAVYKNQNRYNLLFTFPPEEMETIYHLLEPKSTQIPNGYTSSLTLAKNTKRKHQGITNIIKTYIRRNSLEDIIIEGIYVGDTRKPTQIFLYPNEYEEDIKSRIGASKLTLQKVKEKLRRLTNEIEIVSDKYIPGEVFKVRCTNKNCHHIWDTSLNTIMVTPRCQECYPTATKKYTLQGIKNIVEPFKITLKDKEYVDCKKIMKWECNTCKHTWDISWDGLKNDKKGICCPSCTGRPVFLTAELLRKKCIKQNKEVLLLTDHRKDASTPLTWKCLIPHCGHTWTIETEDSYRIPACPICSPGLRGQYNRRSAEKYKHIWNNTKAILYCIECFDNEERFFKIGITKFTVEKRYPNYRKLPYNYRIHYVKETTLYKATILEESLLKMHSEYEYTCKRPFHGAGSEIFYKLIPNYIDTVNNMCYSLEIGDKSNG